ncbi:MAG: hypothetical protein ACREGA_01695 [Candidatus Saccharimonadales bacterium]
MLVRDEKNGQIDPFSPDRLFISLFESCRHRPSAISDARALGGTITSQLLAPKNQHQPGVLKLSDLQTTAERVLKHFDRTAYVHYQAYYGSKKPVKNN